MTPPCSPNQVRWRRPWKQRSPPAIDTSTGPSSTKTRKRLARASTLWSRKLWSRERIFSWSARLVVLISVMFTDAHTTVIAPLFFHQVLGLLVNKTFPNQSTCDDTFFRMARSHPHTLSFSLYFDIQLNEKPFFIEHLLGPRPAVYTFILPDWWCLILNPSTAVVYFPRQEHGERSVWEDSERPEAGLSGSVPRPLAHGLQGRFTIDLFSPGERWAFCNELTRQHLGWVGTSFLSRSRDKATIFPYLKVFLLLCPIEWVKQYFLGFTVFFLCLGKV